MQATLLMCTLNEFDSMQLIMPGVEGGLFDQRILLDGGSTDGTVQLAQALGYEIVIQKEPGLINGLREVYPYLRGDVVVNFSPDGNCVAEVLPKILEKLAEGYDMVIGSRYLPGAGSDDDNWLSAVGNWGFTKSINLLFGGRYTDAMVNFRGCRKTLFGELGLLYDSPRSLEHWVRNMASWEPLMSMRAAKKKINVAEIPAPEPARVAGERKCSHFKGGAIYLAEMIQEAIFWRFATGEAGAMADARGGPREADKRRVG